MKLSVATTFCALTTIVSAYPLSVKRGDGASNSTSNRSQADVAGAAYFITNQPDGNFIVASSIGSDGKLTFGSAVSAGGYGAHGMVTPLGPDPLFSQGSIKVAEGKNGGVLFTINAGSNTAAMFAVNDDDPAKVQMIGYPVSTGGEFPISLTISKQSGQVCVLNGGKVNGVNCYKQDSKIGLVQMADTQRSLDLNQTTPASGPPGSASHVIFNEDGSQLIASVKGVPPNPGFIAIWNVDPQTGALSQDFTKMPPPQGGLLPFSITNIPGQKALLATDPGVGFDIIDLSNGTDGSNRSSSAVTIPGQSATCWSTFSNKTGNIYLTDIGTATVTEVNVDNQLKGSIVKQYPQGNGSATIDNDIATINNKDYLYVMASNATSIMVMSLNGPGQATPLQQFNFAEDAKNAGVSIDANNLQGMTVFVKSK